MMWKAVIIDDEQYCIDSLVSRLKRFDDVITVSGTTTKASAAPALVASIRPDVIFLDINLGTTNGFDLLALLPQPLPVIIFCTAYDHFAIKAFRYNALDYLLKPVDEEELAQAIEKLKAQQVPALKLQQIESAIQVLQRKTTGPQKMALPGTNGLELIALENIIRLEAASNYTQFYLNDGRKIVVSRTLREFEELLDEEGFCRIHQSHIINLSFLRSITRGKTAVAILQTGDEIDISAGRKDAFMEKFKAFYKL